jgi:preprotein translocase subunit SecA
MDAAGKEITWDMIHYDVQLIGGMVLHEGKLQRCKRVKEKH